MQRFQGAGPTITPYDIDDLELHTWFERDRQHVELRDPITDDTIIEYWDDDVSNLVIDGFLNPSDWHGSLFAYARYLGVII